MEPVGRKRLSDDEYLALERGSVEKHELVGGELVAMSRASLRHNVIAANVGDGIRRRLGDRRCVVLHSDQRVNVAETGMYAYPDIVVLCRPAVVHPRDPGTLMNPCLIVEVLSESTEAYDRGAKFGHYGHLPTLAEYVLVSQEARRVEVFRRGDGGQWIFRRFEDEAEVALESLGIALPLGEVYDKLDLVADLRRPSQ